VSIDDRKILVFYLTRLNDSAASRNGSVRGFLEVFTIFHVVRGRDRRKTSDQQRCQQDKSAWLPRCMGHTGRKRHGRALRLKSTCDGIASFVMQLIILQKSLLRKISLTRRGSWTDC